MGWTIKNPFILLGIILVSSIVLFQVGKDFFRLDASVYPEARQESAQISDANTPENTIEAPVDSLVFSSSETPPKQSGDPKKPRPRAEVNVVYEAVPACDYEAMTRDRFSVDTGDGMSTPADCKGFFVYAYYKPGIYTLKYLRNGAVEATAVIDLQKSTDFSSAPTVYQHPIFLINPGPSGTDGEYTEADAIHKAMLLWQTPVERITSSELRNASSTGPGKAWLVSGKESMDRTRCPIDKGLTGFSALELEVNVLTGEHKESWTCAFRPMIYD